MISLRSRSAASALLAAVALLAVLSAPRLFFLLIVRLDSSQGTGTSSSSLVSNAAWKQHASSLSLSESDRETSALVHRRGAMSDNTDEEEEEDVCELPSVLERQLQRQMALLDELRNDFHPAHQRSVFAACWKECLHLRVRNGVVIEVLGEKSGYESRHTSLLRLIEASVRRWPLETDVEVVVSSADGSPELSGEAVLVMARRPEEDRRQILIPDFTFWAWPEVKIADSMRLREELIATDARWAWEEKVAKIFWRGTRLGLGDRMRFMEVADQYPEWFDAVFTSWTDIGLGLGKPRAGSNYVSLPDHCQYKYLAHIEGATYSSRLKFLMSCESVVVLRRPTYEEFWFALLEPGVNVLSIGSDPWVSAILALQTTSDAHLHQIAQNGSKLARLVMDRNLALCYWHRVLTEIGRRQNGIHNSSSASSSVDFESE